MTEVLRTAASVREWRASRRGTVGLVPTMGALHAGHTALIEQAVRDCREAVVSIFVNPTQFGPSDDYLAYPRDEAADLTLLERAGAAAAFVPSVDEIYSRGAASGGVEQATRVVPGAIAAPLEGARRRGHFTGVATVVTKLLAITTPHVAYFGQKDFQQLRVVQTVARDLALAVRIVGCPIVRDGDGLALSSRNAYLSAQERQRALALSRGLFAARDAFARGERAASALRDVVTRIAREAGTPEYVSVADPFTLAELRGRVERAVISLAVRVGKARLIDNVLVGVALEEIA